MKIVTSSLSKAAGVGYLIATQGVKVINGPNITASSDVAFSAQGNYQGGIITGTPLFENLAYRKKSLWSAFGWTLSCRGLWSAEKV